MLRQIRQKFKELRTARKLMKDDDFKEVITHPKVQAIFKDPAFKSAMQSNNPQKIASNPRLAALMRDPEVAPLLRKLDPSKLRQMAG